MVLLDQEQYFFKILIIKILEIKNMEKPQVLYETSFSCLLDELYVIPALNAKKVL